MSHLHSIDKYGGRWTNEEREKFFVFCQLNRAIPYPKLCDVFDALMEKYWRDNIYRSFIISVYPARNEERIAEILKKIGYRFPNQTAKFMVANGWVDAIFLKSCTREEMVQSCKGFGYKLASLFLRNTREKNFAVIDTHIKWFLKEVGIDIRLSYLELEEAFGRIACAQKMSMYALDMQIWEQRRKK